MNIEELERHLEAGDLSPYHWEYVTNLFKTQEVRIDTLQDALRGVLRRAEEYLGYILHPEHEARLRSILGDS